MGNAVYGTFLPVYLHSEGFSQTQIGTLLSFGPFVAMLGQPVWGALGDRAKAKNNVLQVLLIGSGISVLLFPLSSWFPYLLLVICAFTFFQTSIFAISDTITLEQLDKQKSVWSFGKIRLGGTLGYAVMSLIFGIIAGKHIGSMFPIYAATMLAAMLLLARFPSVAGRSAAVKNTNFSVLFRNRKLMLYLGINFVVQVTLGYYYSFFPVYYKELGANSTLLGWSMVISSLSEIPFLLYSGKILSRIKVSYVLLGAGLAAAVRWLLFSQMSSPVWMLPVQILHGLIFIVLSVTMATFINKEVPKEWKASGQTLNGLISLGAARIVGSFIGGIAASAFGMRKVFMYNALILILCIVMFGVIMALSARMTVPQRSGIQK